MNPNRYTPADYNCKRGKSADFGPCKKQSKPDCESVNQFGGCGGIASTNLEGAGEYVNQFGVLVVRRRPRRSL